MALSRVMKNVLRSEKQPRAMRKPDNAVGEGNNKDSPGTTRQYTSPKVKNSAPRYKQPDPRTEGKSGPLK